MIEKIKNTNIDYWRLSDVDTGSVPYQIASLAVYIKKMSKHLSNGNKKDIPAKRALLKMVARRRRYENYLVKNKYDKLEELKSWIKKIQ